MDHHVISFWSLASTHLTLFQKYLHDSTTFHSCCIYLHFISLLGWTLQMVIDFHGTSFHQVNNLHGRTEKSTFKNVFFSSGKFDLITRGIVSVLIFILVCIYVANIGISYSEAKERQSLNAIQAWNVNTEEKLRYFWNIGQYIFLNGIFSSVT